MRYRIIALTGAAAESGNTIQVTQKNSTATIDFTNQTAIAEIEPAQLSDVKAGSCVAIRPTRDGAPQA